MKNVFKSSLLHEKCIFNVYLFSLKNQKFKVLKKLKSFKKIIF